MSNLYYNALIKQPQNIKIKAMQKLESINIFSLPSKIKNSDIEAMFNGLLILIKEKIQQEQNEKYLQLKLKYSRLEYLYKTIKSRLIK